GLCDALLHDAECLAIVHHTSICQTEEGEAEQLRKAVIDFPGDGQAIPAEVNSARRISLPVGMGTKPDKILHQRVFISLLTADPQRLFELPIRFLQVSTHLLHELKAQETAGEDFLISC